MFGIIKTTVTSAVVLGAVGVAAWRLFLFEQWVEDVEYDANVDANKALEDFEEDETAKKKKKKDDAKKGKNKAKSDADNILEEAEKK